MTSFVGIRRTLWNQYGGLSQRRARELGGVDRMFWVIMSFVGLIALGERRRDLLWLLLAPLLVMTAGNVLGKWPLGAFRTNVFVCAYTIPLALLGMQRLATSWRHSAILGGLVLGLTIVPGFMYGFDWHGHKRLFTRDHYQREVLDKLYAYRKQQLAKDPSAATGRALTRAAHLLAVQLLPARPPEIQREIPDIFRHEFRRQEGQSGRARHRVAQSAAQRKARHVDRHVVAASDPDKVERAAQRDADVVIRERVADQHVLMFLKPKTD